MGRCISLAEWVEQLPFDPFILQPEPENTALKIGPLYSMQSKYVEMAYIEVGESIAAGATHNLFQSDSFAPFFDADGLLKMYSKDRNDVVSNKRALWLDNQRIEVEVRRNEQIRNAGITIFVLGDTHVVHHWQNFTEENALKLLEQSAQRVTENDRTQIDAFDRNHTAMDVTH